MAKTRGRPSAKPAKAITESVPVSNTPKVQLSSEVANPPQLFILPEHLSNEARIVQLENPRHGMDSPYIVCPESGFYELTRVSVPKTTPRSWLLSSEDSANPVQKGNGYQLEGAAGTNDKFSNNGYVLRNANLMVSTPIDSLFFILPTLAPNSAPKASEPQKKLFLSGEDYLDRLATSSPQLSSFIRTDSLRISIEKRMATVCDTVEAGDETMYRINEEKLLGELLKKARKMTKLGLTPSMEEKFIRKALEVPTTIIVIQEEEPTKENTVAVESELPTPVETPDTQSTDVSMGSAATSHSEVSTAATSVLEDSSNTVTERAKKPTIPPIDAPDGIADLLRLRTALLFICSKYLPPHISELVKKVATSSTASTDFTPLDTHLALLAKQRQEALTARSLGDATRKRDFVEDDEDESRAEKKRKKEEEEKRKKVGESRGVKNLKKVNVSGMKKMSDFFKKK